MLLERFAVVIAPGVLAGCVPWERMAPLIIGRPDQKGWTGRDNRMFVEGVLWIVRTGSPWRDLPEAFGDWNSVFQRHLVECCFSKLKPFRRVATRFEKTARNYRAVVTLAAIILLMR